MVGEDFRSQAYYNFHKMMGLKVALKEKNEIAEMQQAEIVNKQGDIEKLEKEMADNQMH